MTTSRRSRLLQYRAGGDYDASKFPLDLFDPDYSQPLLPDVGELEEAINRGKQLGFYVQEHAALGDRVTVTLNGRWDRADFDGQKQTAFSPRVGATAAVLPGVSLYTAWAKSFSPQFGSQILLDSADGEPTSLGQAPPERGRNEEIGAKLALPTLHLNATLAAYRLTRTNVLVTDPDFPLFSRVTGKQRSRGFEAEAHWRPSPAWSADVAYSYIRARIVEDTVFPIGTPTPNVPHHNLAGYVRYEVQNGRLRGLGVIAGAQYNSARFVYDSGYVGTPFGRDAPLRLPPYTLLNAGLSYGLGPWLTQANVNNLLNERYFPDACCIQRVTQGQPRNFRLTLSRRF